MRKRILFLFLAVIILAGGLITWQRLYQSNQKQNQPEPVENNQQIYATPTLSGNEDQARSIIMHSENHQGETAFDLLKSEHEVAYKEYDFGVFIESIDGLAGDDKHYWALYRNSEYVSVSADKLILGVLDKVEFRYEEVAQAPFIE